MLLNLSDTKVHIQMTETGKQSGRREQKDRSINIFTSKDQEVLQTQNKNVSSFQRNWERNSNYFIYMGRKKGKEIKVGELNSYPPQQEDNTWYLTLAN